MPNSYLDYLIDPSFPGVNRLFVLSFENNADRAERRYYLSKVEIKDYNFMVDGQNYFDEHFKNNTRTYDNIKNNTTGQGDDCTTGLLLDYP